MYIYIRIYVYICISIYVYMYICIYSSNAINTINLILDYQFLPRVHRVSYQIHKAKPKN